MADPMNDMEASMAGARFCVGSSTSMHRGHAATDASRTVEQRGHETGIIDVSLPSPSPTPIWPVGTPEST
jgi:hypothetical protein